VTASSEDSEQIAKSPTYFLWIFTADR